MRIAGIATVVPPHRLPQKEVVDHASAVFASRFRDFERLRPVFESTGIHMRYSVRPFEWFHENRNWQQRNEAYLEGAIDLFTKAARAVMTAAAVKAAEIDAIVTVSSTGIATPSLEGHAHQALGFRPDVSRVPVFGLGCAGGVTGLALGARLAKATPGSKVLVVAVEICTLAFRGDALTKSNIVATALFGDGAAAVVLTSDDKGESEGEGARVVGSGEHLWPDTLDVMGWQVDPVGFGAIFSASIPDLVRERMRPAAETFLVGRGEAIDDLDGFVFHPGGTKVIHALESAFELGEGCLGVERRILRDYGNMSAPTALFVLEEKLRTGLGGRNLMAALGPGFTASFVRIDG